MPSSIDLDAPCKEGLILEISFAAGKFSETQQTIAPLWDSGLYPPLHISEQQTVLHNVEKAYNHLNNNQTHPDS